MMTTATDHKNNLNRSVLKKDYARTLRVETIANSAGGTAQVAIVAQPSIGFLTQSTIPTAPPRKTRKTTLAASLSDSPAQNPNRIGLPAGHDGAHGHGSSCRDYCIWHPRPSKRRNAWDWPNFNADPEQENLAQINR